MAITAQCRTNDLGQPASMGIGSDFKTSLSDLATAEPPDPSKAEWKFYKRSTLSKLNTWERCPDGLHVLASRALEKNPSHTPVLVRSIARGYRFQIDRIIYVFRWGKIFEVRAK